MIVDAQLFLSLSEMKVCERIDPEACVRGGIFVVKARAICTVRTVPYLYD